MIASDPWIMRTNVGQGTAHRQASGASRRITADAALWA